MSLLYHFLVLLFELLHSSGTGTGSTLVAGDMDLLDMRQLLNRLQDDDHHDCGAVRVGDDATWTLQRVSGVDLRHYQWHVVVHTEGAGVVDHHSAVLRDRVRKLLTRTSTGRGEGDVHTLEVVVVLQKFHLIVLAFEVVKAAGTTCRAEQHKVINGEITLSEDTQKLLAHCATGTDNSYSHNLFLSLIL